MTPREILRPPDTLDKLHESRCSFDPSPAGRSPGVSAVPLRTAAISSYVPIKSRLITTNGNCSDTAPRPRRSETIDSRAAIRVTTSLSFDSGIYGRSDMGGLACSASDSLSGVLGPREPNRPVRRGNSGSPSPRRPPPSIDRPVRLSLRDTGDIKIL